MSKTITMIGFTLLALGVSCADSECLIVPIVMAITGALLMNLGNKENIEK